MSKCCVVSDFDMLYFLLQNYHVSQLNEREENILSLLVHTRIRRNFKSFSHLLVFFPKSTSALRKKEKSFTVNNCRIVQLQFSIQSSSKYSKPIFPMKS